ncbi:MAG: FliH/SctL family protein [Pseudomonadota bacterium]
MTRASGADSLDHDADAARWEPPVIGENGVQPVRRLPTAAEIEAIEEEARQNGFESGYAEGHALGKQEAEKAARARSDKTLREAVAALESVARGLNDPLADAAEALEPELLALVTALARQVLRVELETRPTVIESVLHEALQQLPGRDRPVRIHLHPEDQGLVEQFEKRTDREISWVADASLARGGCRVESGAAVVDASLERRLQHAIEALWNNAYPGDDSAGGEPDDGELTDSEGRHERTD